MQKRCCNISVAVWPSEPGQRPLPLPDHSPVSYAGSGEQERQLDDSLSYVFLSDPYMYPVCVCVYIHMCAYIRVCVGEYMYYRPQTTGAQIYMYITYIYVYMYIHIIYVCNTHTYMYIHVYMYITYTCICISHVYYIYVYMYITCMYIT